MNSIVTSSDTEESGAELELCICCLKPNRPGTPFCEHCATPLTSYAATGPFESILAEGDFWRKLMKRAEGRSWGRLAVTGFIVLMLLAVLSGVILPR